MKLHHIDGKHLYHFFFYGRKRVQENYESLNKINVFPVPDGDTGTNLALTMHATVEQTPSSDSVSVVGEQLADAALSGSRGNSGIIFAQFVQGLSAAIRGKHRINPREFIHAARSGVESAYQALSKPVEGTILTVMKAWANSLHSLHEKGVDFVDNLHQSLETARKALAETPKQLKQLRDAGVVDAGAQGFVHFLEGMLHFIREGKTVETTALSPLQIAEDHHEILDQKITHRYCTELFIRGAGMNPGEIRKILESFGDSVIVGGSSEKMHLHLHTNTPAEVVDRLRSFATLTRQKIDDMLRQYEDLHRRKGRIALVTDSACDLPETVLDDYQIHVIPLNLSFGENVYLDKLSIHPKRFYELLDEESVFPSTAQPSVKQIEILYRSLAASYDSIISVHLADALSGTYNAACQAAAKVTEAKISVIDSRTLSTSLGLIVLNTAREIMNGTPHDEIVRQIETWIQKAKILVSVQTLKYMVRGGRVSPLKGKIASWLNLKPIVSLDAEGRSILTGKAFSTRSNLHKIIKMIAELNAQQKVRAYALGHANASDEAAAFADQIQKILGFMPSFIIEIAPVIGVHAGVGALSVSVLTE